jgi:hypothetical protein
MVIYICIFIRMCLNLLRLSSYRVLPIRYEDRGEHCTRRAIRKSILGSQVSYLATISVLIQNTKSFFVFELFKGRGRRF